MSPYVGIMSQMCSMVGVYIDLVYCWCTSFAVISAKLNGAGGIFNKPRDVYVELIVDSSSSKKTPVRKKTNTPQWDEQLQVCGWMSNLSFYLFDRRFLEMR